MKLQYDDADVCVTVLGLLNLNQNFKKKKKQTKTQTKQKTPDSLLVWWHQSPYKRKQLSLGTTEDISLQSRADV